LGREKRRHKHVYYSVKKEGEKGCFVHWRGQGEEGSFLMWTTLPSHQRKRKVGRRVKSLRRSRQLFSLVAAPEKKSHPFSNLGRGGKEVRNGKKKKKFLHLIRLGGGDFPSFVKESRADLIGGASNSIIL